ncbi:MAG: hypothetical protein H6R26_887 [Proteobacteria bacterium]|nr:hypothetical protein [Pseudomonadota bacterium]
MSTLSKGTLVDWKDEKGFGFVRPAEGGRDYFVHISAFRKGMLRRPAVGDIVHFEPATGPRSGGQRRIAHAFIDGVGYVDPDAPPSRLEVLLQKAMVGGPVVFSLYVIWKTGNPIPLGSYMFMSVLTVMIYAVDKKHALQDRWRIPESYLHGLELLGGWPGGLLAQSQFRHKLKKPSYQRIFWAIVILHGCGWLAFLYFANFTAG